jgi:hypothetical protein
MLGTTPLIWYQAFEAAYGNKKGEPERSPLYKLIKAL